jgi:hypothetical protein
MQIKMDTRPIHVAALIVMMVIGPLTPPILMEMVLARVRETVMTKTVIQIPASSLTVTTKQIGCRAQTALQWRQ